MPSPPRLEKLQGCGSYIRPDGRSVVNLATATEKRPKQGDTSQVTSRPREIVEPVGEVNPKFKSLTLDDAKTVPNMINLAGGLATASSLYGLLKVLLHFPEIQKKAYKEISKVLTKTRKVTFRDRPSLPYVSAILKEVERFFAIVPLRVPHRAVVDTH